MFYSNSGPTSRAAKWSPRAEFTVFLSALSLSRRLLFCKGTYVKRNYKSPAIALADFTTGNNVRLRRLECREREKKKVYRGKVKWNSLSVH